MRIHIVSLFPEYFVGPFSCGPTRVVQEKNVLEVAVVNPRDFTEDPHRTVDDYPFGGGAGMVLKPEPLFKAIESVRTEGTRTVMLSPRGRRFEQADARELGGLDHVVLVCGRYKGIDERVREALVDDELSVGDFVLAGGEAAAVMVVEAVARLLPGAVEHEESVNTDSFSPALLDAPYYTRPRSFRGMDAPEVLVSGDHAAIARWRRHRSLALTARLRPDLMRDEVLDDEERLLLMRELGLRDSEPGPSEIEKENHNGKKEEEG